MLVSHVFRMCISIDEGSTNKNAKSTTNDWQLRLKQCNHDDANQKWEFEYLGDVAGLIRNPKTNLCLTSSLKQLPPVSVDDLHTHSVLTLESCHHQLCAQVFDAHASTEAEERISFPPQEESFKASELPALIRKPSIPSSLRAKKRHKPSLFCWVMSHPKTLDPKAIAVNQTWGRVCDSLWFVVSEHAAPLGERVNKLPVLTVNLGRKESRQTLWQKSQLAWKAIIDRFEDKFDWYMRADDDSYVSVENLKQFLSQKDPNKPLYYGRVYHSNLGDFYSGMFVMILVYH